jgi:hypothetical protein
VPLGFADLTALPGNHIAHFYQTTEEWKDLLISYQKAGLEAGDKCVYLMRPGRRQEWQEALEAAGADVDGALASGQLVVVEDKDDAKERQEALAAALDEIGGNYAVLRSGGDVNWTETHWEWETHITTVEGPQAVFLCQYDITAFGGDVIIDALRTHPVCIVGSAVIGNPFYEELDILRERLTRRTLASTS